MKLKFYLPLKKWLSAIVMLVCGCNSLSAQSCSNLNLQFKADIVSACSTNTMSMMHDINGLPYLYVANKEAGLTIFNISDPSSPQLIATVPVSMFGNHDVMNVSQQGDFLYLAIGNHFSFLLVPPDSSGMAIVDVSTPSQPFVTDYWIFNGPVAGSAIAVADGDFAYLGAMTNGLIILNIADKTQIALEAQFLPDINFPDPNPVNQAKYNARGLVVKNDVVYLCFDAGGIRIVNVADKSNPVETGRYANPALNGLPRAYNNLVLDSIYTYVTVDYCGLEVLNVFDTANITLAGQWNPYNCESNPFNWFTSPGHTNEIRFDPDCRLAFLSSGKSEMHVIDLNDPTNPDSCNYFGSVNDSLGTWGVNIYNGQLYLSYICTLTNIPFLGIWSGLKIFEYTTCSTSDMELSESGFFISNPVEEQLILGGSLNQYSMLFITDVGGRTVFSVTGDQIKGKLDISTLDKGVYFLHLYGKRVTELKKFVKL
ncbi:MAG TPA: T9SS type A sorting domain-containing protein [Bacteroidia bacterium]|nr:T9SS type A sorting domain-containing protein [Bacteroidia bacterium]